MRTVLVYSLLLIFFYSTNAASPAAGDTFYLSPDGNDSRSGRTPGEAWATFDRAWLDLYPGDTLVLLDGVYYQPIDPNVRSGEPGRPITIRAQNDGKAIVDGQFTEHPVRIQHWKLAPEAHYVIEGIVARNSVLYVYDVEIPYITLRRVSGYDAHTDDGGIVFSLRADHILLEDCVAAGSGRKMIMIYQSAHNIVRRCFANWGSFDGRQWHDPWPFGDGIQIYNGSYNIIENSISYSSLPGWGISVQANSDNVSAVDNQVLGSIAIGAGTDANGNPINWGTTRPQPSPYSEMRDFTWPNQRAGFMVWGQGELRNNRFQDVFAWRNAGLGFGVSRPYGPGSRSSVIHRATLLNNGLDAPNSDGGVGVDLRLDGEWTVTDSFVEGTEYQGEGASLINRYVDGQLTSEPLWPWPMEERIQNELGLSVTGLILPIVEEYTSGSPGPIPATPTISPTVPTPAPGTPPSSNNLFLPLVGSIN